MNIVELALRDLTARDARALGTRMTEFHALLRELEVSTPELDRLVDAAPTAGALETSSLSAGTVARGIFISPPKDLTS
ncbi:hypothetical protein [Nocardia sp. NPDC052316]|uniref:hypothetical protein n=1 Tax=Nocardia sp. NPDC052316 TaxID=3364329 RepID=UPI0037C6B6D9